MIHATAQMRYRQLVEARILKRGVLAALTAILLSAGIGARSVQVQQAGLSALDYFQIQDLNARYNHGLDRGDGELFASVFAADGVLVDETGRTATGRAELAALAAATPGAGPTNLRHFNTNLAVDPAPTGAWAWSMVAIVNPVPGKPRDGWTAGQYWDELARTPQGWRIKKRTFYRQGAAKPDTQPMSATLPRLSAGSAQERINGLTAADYAQIYQLYAHFAWAYDKSLDTGAGFADLFTSDGTFVDVKGRAATGRMNLMEMLMRFGDPQQVRTVISNIMLEPTAGGVNARAYIMARRYPQLPDAAYQEPGGMSFAQLVRTVDGWRFRRHQIVAPQAPIPPEVTTAAGSAPARPGTTARNASPLGPEDIAEIMHVVARYAHGFERSDPAIYRSIWATPQTAEFRDEGLTPKDVGVVGVESMIQAYVAPTLNTPLVRARHQTWTIRVDPAPWGAVARGFMLNGYYTDVMVKTPQGWRIKYRNYRRDNPMAPLRPEGPPGPTD